MRIYTKVVIPGHNKNAEYYAARKWCTRTVGAIIKGKGAVRPWYARRCWVEKLIPSGSGYEYFQEPSFYFRNAADATMFALVWAKEFRQT